MNGFFFWGGGRIMEYFIFKNNIALEIGILFLYIGEKEKIIMVFFSYLIFVSV